MRKSKIAVKAKNKAGLKTILTLQNMAAGSLLLTLLVVGSLLYFNVGVSEDSKAEKKAMWFAATTPNITNYNFSTNSLSSLSNMSGSTQLIGSNIASGATSGNSAVTNIGFDFWFMGVRFTQFSVNCNGIVRFGGTQVAGSANSFRIDGNYRASAFSAADLSPNTHFFKTSSTGKVHYKVSGIAPNRVLTIEWLNMGIDESSSTVDATFQAAMYETAPNNLSGGTIEFTYGTLKVGNISNDIAYGLTGIGSSSTTYMSVQTSSTTYNDITNTQVSSAGTLHTASTTKAIFNYFKANTSIASFNSTLLTRRRYGFRSNAPNGTAPTDLTACASNTSVRLQWNAGSTTNRVGYVIYQSTDGSNYQFASQVASDVQSTSITGLAANTQYWFRVYDVTEGKLSSLDPTGQTSTTTKPFTTVYSVKDGTWSDPTVWSSGAVPTITDNVVIGCSAGNTVTVNTTNAYSRDLTIESGSLLTMSATNTLTMNGNFTINGSFALNGANAKLAGNFVNAGTITTGINSNFTFNGTAVQTVTSSTVPSFYNLIINNTNATGITLANTDISASYQIDFTDGVINTGTYKVIFTDNAKVLNVSANSYVDGWVRKIGNDAFTFPVGNAGFYAPAGISAPATLTDHFTATYRKKDAGASPYNYTLTNKDASLKEVTNKEHWIIDRTGGSSSVSVTLSYDNTRSDYTDNTNLPVMQVCRWNGSTWKNQGATSALKTAFKGNIVALDPVSNFSPFTLGVAYPNAPLPITLISFTAQQEDSQIAVAWATASEINNDYFTLERSKDGKVFESIKTVKGAGTSTVYKQYTYTDLSPIPGFSYYRLKQTDYDGTYQYSKVVAVNTTDVNAPESQLTLLSVSPNPLYDKCLVKFHLKDEGTVEIQFMNMLGQVMITKLVQALKGDNEFKFSNETQNLIPGMYVLSVVHNNKAKTVKLIKK
jgi:hypothetical protein